MPSPFEFAVENARCFRSTGFMPITPITFLAGENSSGKTSFFALMYEAISSFFGHYIPDDEMEFDLGSFDDVIHKSDRPAAREYSLKFRIPYSQNAEVDPGRRISDVTLSLVYGEHRGQRIVNGVIIYVGDYSISVRRTEKSVIVSVPLDTGICESRLTLKDTSFYSSNSIDGFYRVRRALDAVRQSLRGGKTDTHFAVANNRSSKANSLLYSRALAVGTSAFDFAHNALSWPVRGTAPIRSAPKRVYLIGSSGQASAADRVPLALNQLKLYEPEKWDQMRRRLSQFGLATGLFHDIDIQRLKGRRRDAPFELIVCHGDIQSNIKDVGYGISQVIPFIVDLILADLEQDKKSGLPVGLHYIQQPEIHLHPAAQAALGSFLYEYARDTGNYFVIETHSDFVIDRIRQHLRSARAEDVTEASMLFFEESGGESFVYPIKFDRLGNVLNAPSSYRQFFLAEEVRNFGS